MVACFLLLVVVCAVVNEFSLLQLKKTSETTKYLPSPEFGPEWIDTLCNVSERAERERQWNKID